LKILKWLGEWRWYFIISVTDLFFVFTFQIRQQVAPIVVQISGIHCQYSNSIADLGLILWPGLAEKFAE
jgi:hypothetical protein